MNSIKSLSKRMNRNFFRNFVIALFFLFIGNLSALFAQTNRGRISGIVTDSSSAVVANAAVTAFDPSTNFSRSATTDENGFYTLSNFPVAAYTVSVEAPIFKKSVKNENALSADAWVTVDFTLEAGQISETVEVAQTNIEVRKPLVRGQPETRYLRNGVLPPA